MNNFRLLIHHHAVAFQSPSKEIFVPSFIGRWVNALASQVGQIGLLLYQSDTIRPEQDEIVQANNVTLWSLGPPGKTWDRVARINHLRKVCAKASQEADGLLVRGVTPRQMDVWNSTTLQNKAFLLVGSLKQTKPVLNPTFWGLYGFLIWYWRLIEVMRMTRQGVVIANSPYLVSELAQFNRHSSFVPTNSIRLEEFPPFLVRKLSDPGRILFCGRVVAEKGIVELIQAVAKLNQLQPCVLDIVGPFEPRFRMMIETLSGELGIFESIHWHGRIPYGDALFAMYRQADVFILPTYFEGFPHVIWEAAANCCPVITTRVGGIPAIWKDSLHGLLVSPKDADALFEAVLKLFNDEDLRCRLIKNGYDYAREFSVEACATRLIDTLYENGWGKDVVE